MDKNSEPTADPGGGTTLRLVSSRPAGCTSETTSTVETVAGSVTIRVRRIRHRAWMGGRGYVTVERAEIALHTPLSRGFRTLPDVALFNAIGVWPEHASDLELHLRIGALAEEVAERKALAADRAPVRRMAPAADTREALRRLLNLRCGQYERATGADASETRHAVAEAASLGRTTSSMALSRSEMGEAVSLVEMQMRAAGLDIETMDAARAAQMREAA